MTPPETIKFGDTEYRIADIHKGRDRKGVAPVNWTRVSFKVPDAFTAPANVDQWLTENCPGLWMSYHYADPRSKTHERLMVVRFEEKNDALFFKLRGGHQAWQSE